MGEIMEAAEGSPLLLLTEGAEGVERDIRQVQGFLQTCLTTRRLRISEMKREMHRCELTMGKKDPPPTLSSRYRKK
jgi:hypothetical protein